MDIDLEELAAIIELLDKTDFTQFRFEKGDLRIAVSRGESLDPGTSASPAVAASAPVPPPAPPAAAPAVAAQTRSATPAAPPPAAAADDLAEDEMVVRSPMLGSFYSAPKPGDPPFVQVGQAVEADAVVCIIEVMKLMNSVVAGRAGVVRRMLVRDGELVEFDQPLFVLARS